MKHYFNITGPCFPHMHYMLPPEDRLKGAHLARYLEQQLYWVLHAPRQTGKTTFLLSWARHLNAGGQYAAFYVTVEGTQEVTEAERAMPIIARQVISSAKHFGLPVPTMPTVEPGVMVTNILAQLSKLVAPKPLVVLFDEVDVLAGPALVSFLRQLRGGFAGRGVGEFPTSVALVGMRDLKDYLVRSKDGVSLNPGSPFNIKHDSATLTNFTRADLDALTRQHTDEHGQRFTEEALDAIFLQTRGQPWLVNALCFRAVMDICPPETGRPITPAEIDAARENIILSRAVHIDSLAERLRDDRVKRVVQPILIGDSDPTLAEGDDFRLCMDLGLVDLERGTPIIANPIYREVLARSLTYGMQLAIPEPEFRWENADGTLDMDALLREFQKFWRRHSAAWELKINYSEAFPHLLLMAFLQRVVNGGGRIEREYAAGRGRVDLAVEYAGRTHVIELKLIREGDTREDFLEMGREQITRYVEETAAATAHLVLFDRRPEWKAKPWPERLGWDELPADTDAKTCAVTVLWC